MAANTQPSKQDTETSRKDKPGTPVDPADHDVSRTGERTPSQEDGRENPQPKK